MPPIGAQRAGARRAEEERMPERQEKDDLDRLGNAIADADAGMTVAFDVFSQADEDIYRNILR